MDLECYATIAGLMLTIMVLIFTVKTYLHAKVGEIRGSLESIGETSLSHNLKVKPALEDVGFLHKQISPRKPPDLSGEELAKVFLHFLIPLNAIFIEAFKSACVFPHLLHMNSFPLLTPLSPHLEHIVDVP